MQVANNKKALQEHLRRRYQKQIDVVMQAANKEVHEIQQESKQLARREENRIMIDAKTASSMKQQAQIALAKEQARQDINAALAKLRKEVINLIREEHEAMSKKEKQLYLDALQADIKKQTQQHKQTFEIEQDINTMSVRAVSEELIIEDGFTQRLKEQEEEITRQIKELIT